MRRRGSRRCAVGEAVLDLGGFRRLDRMEGGGRGAEGVRNVSHTAKDD